MHNKNGQNSVSGGIYLKLDVDGEKRHATRLMVRKDVILAIDDGDEYLTIEFDAVVTNGGRR
ncbi:hypothetical protein QBD01_002345 [Ochrobactrum sp. 19YEA23]|uniref:hypothetical protein n=1 Tax=Ochrobactrum sp. 19YEA23 TaxID=3039854 RepID=UPI00247933E1|nr:hypothetical protein [Ochrobactrum sp. 19YEA23]